MHANTAKAVIYCRAQATNHGVGRVAPYSQPPFRLVVRRGGRARRTKPSRLDRVGPRGTQRRPPHKLRPVPNGRAAGEFRNFKSCRGPETSRGRAVPAVRPRSLPVGRRLGPGIKKAVPSAPEVDSPQATTFQQRKKDDGYFKFVDVGEDSTYKDYCLKFDLDSGKAMLSKSNCDNDSTKLWNLHDSGKLTFSFPDPLGGWYKSSTAREVMNYDSRRRRGLFISAQRVHAGRR